MNPRECIEQIEQADPEVAVFCALVTTQLRKGVITPRYAVETLYDMVDDLETRVRMVSPDQLPPSSRATPPTRLSAS